MSRRAGFLALAGLLVGAALAACHISSRKTHYGACKGYCRWLDDRGDGWPECRRDCMTTLDDAGEISDSCAINYIVVVECVDQLEPADADAWLDARGSDDAYPCREDTVDFIRSCPDLWFTARGYDDPARFW